jgi:hypothetical protein
LEVNRAGKKYPISFIAHFNLFITLLKGLQLVEMARSSSKRKKDLGFRTLDKQRLVCIATVRKRILAFIIIILCGQHGRFQTKIDNHDISTRYRYNIYVPNTNLSIKKEY